MWAYIPSIYQYIFVNSMTECNWIQQRAINLSCVLHRGAEGNGTGHRLGLCQASPALLGKDGHERVRKKKEQRCRDYRVNQRMFKEWRKRVKNRKLGHFWLSIQTVLKALNLTDGSSAMTRINSNRFFSFHLNTVPEPWSMAMPNPSALFCLSKAFRSKTLVRKKTGTHTVKKHK